MEQIHSIDEKAARQKNGWFMLAVVFPTTEISMGLPSSSLTFCLSLFSVIAFSESLRAEPKVIFAGFTALQKSTNGDEKSLRGSAQEVADILKDEIQTRVDMAGIEILEARISHLAYSPEIAITKRIYPKKSVTFQRSVILSEQREHVCFVGL